MTSCIVTCGVGLVLVSSNGGIIMYCIRSVNDNWQATTVHHVGRSVGRSVELEEPKNGFHSSAADPTARERSCDTRVAYPRRNIIIKLFTGRPLLERCYGHVRGYFFSAAN